MGVTPAEVVQTMTQAARQCLRHALSHLIALTGAVVVVLQRGEGEGAAGELAGKRKREGELAHQPVKHSLWEQDSLGAYSEVLFGYLDNEVGALRQKRAEYGEARKLSDGSDSCWSGSDSDSGSEAMLEAGTRQGHLHYTCTGGCCGGGCTRVGAGERGTGCPTATPRQ